ncbi:N-acetyltransferase [Alkalihalophilus lindianensis]|uniref:N-acetyltransferase n=1 Tax=Alkalihalophilus lindianensis TaxID=1630542 RepID=A0ABU3X924_9BACI|nr:N-acetyltransferase [Alkalihalophilus lindianensis]MDV2684375.1 N-acetyltransferase [Alkalihalophilus lindianensis]
MQLSFITSANLDKLAIYLEEMNNKPESHIGFCGEKVSEIRDTLKDEFSDLPLEKSFIVATEGQTVIGALGVDVDKDEGSAEVWGPFTSTNEDVEGEMWNTLMTSLESEVQTFMFFINKNNERATTFVEGLHAENKGSHLILKAHRDHFSSIEDNNIVRIEPQYVDSFKQLHDQLFPDTYYSGQDIIEKLKENDQHLFILKRNDTEIDGYVYFEANPEHAEGNIEFIAVSEKARNKGNATKLIQVALQTLYQYKEIEEITLCVGKTNMKAINLYLAAGFKREHELNYYVYETKSKE